MLNFLDRFKSSPPKTERSFFSLGQKDGKFFADPNSLSSLDNYDAHKAAADELNSHVALLAELRGAVLPLEGSEVDKNPRPDVVAVTDLPLNGKTASAVIRHYTNCSVVEARVNDNGQTITLFDQLDGKNETLRFGSGGRYYEVESEMGKSVVSVELKKS